MKLLKLISRLALISAVLAATATQTFALGDSKSGKIAAGCYSVFAVMNNGDLVGWGNIGNYDSNLGGPAPQPTPVKIMEDVVYVSAGYKHFAAVKKDGTLWVWGENSNYQVGNGEREYQDEPVKVLNNVKQVSTGVNHTLALKTDGTVWGWGLNQNGAVDGSINEKFIKIPTQNNALKGKIVTQVSAGGAHSLAIVNGSAWGWGWNFMYQLGLGNDDDVFAPKLIESGTFASAGFEQSVLSNGGTPLVFGSNSGYRMSANKGNTMNKLFKTPANALTITNNEVIQLSSISMVSTSWKHSMAITNNGKLYGIGNNDSGQLGLNSYNSVKGFTEVTGIGTITDVAAGYLNTVALTDTKDVLVAGTNNNAGVTYSENMNSSAEMNSSVFLKVLNLEKDIGKY